MTDLVDLFATYTTGLPSCPLYREWCGIALVAGALERRVWAEYGRMIAYPNLSVMLVGPPGAGKGIISCVRDLWTLTPEESFHVGRKSYSKASLADDLGAASKIFLPLNGGDPLEYHSLLIAAEEFPVLFPRFDLEFLAFLSDLWNADSVYSERRRTSDVKSLVIKNPLVNLIVGYQPSVMATTLPASAWDQGFMRRTVMVWNGIPELRSLFDASPRDLKLESLITSRLKSLAGLYGRMKWEESAAARIESWHLDGGEPRPIHLRLQSYCNTRSHLAVKLAIVASLAEDEELVIRLRHMERSLSWLLTCEALMPEIFRAMVGDSDTHLITDTHNMMLSLYARQKPRLVHGKIIWQYLKDRAPSNKIAYIVSTMEKSGLIEREQGTDFWKPIAGASRAQ